MLKTKVCIVGSGPAGAVASLYLSKFNIPHILIERKKFPRDKVCGDCFDGRVHAILNDIDENILQEMYLNEIVQDVGLLSYMTTKQKIFAVKMPASQKPRLSARRGEFDAYLQDIAKNKPFCSFLEHENVRNIDKKGSLIFIQTSKQTIEASIVIIAAGANSPLVQKMLPQNNNGGHFILTARAYFKNITSKFSQPAVQVHLIKKPVECYLYFVDLPKGVTNVELFILRKKVLQHNINPELLLQELIQQKTFSDLFRNAEQISQTETTSIGKSFSISNISDAHVLLCGASALSVNPLTGLGVGEAILTAKLAAEQCLQAFELNDFSASAMKNYDVNVYRMLHKDRSFGKQADLTVTHFLKVYDVLLGLLNKYEFIGNAIGNALSKV